MSGEGYRPQGSIRAARDGSQLPELTPLLIPLVACNDSRVDDGRVIGDPMEAALVILAAKGGIAQDRVAQRLPRLAEVPFDSAHKLMATFRRQDDQVHMFVKGAPDVLLARCEAWVVGGEDRPLSSGDRQRIDAEYLALAEGGLRGLLIASRTIPASAFDVSGDLLAWVNGLTFIGLAGLMDPPRPGVKEAIARCKQAGIVVKMITGDHKSTASAIARELGLLGNTISGGELDRMDSDQLAAVIDDIAVFARVTPAHKVKIVRALQAKGHVVAMTGDGVNDAPALKSADIGVAMGVTGTAVAKEAATMVLTDDNFATIVSAVRQGRTLYDNILKFVRLQLSTTIGAILNVFFAPLASLPEPFTPIQILWVAIIMDGPPAVSLALDAARPGIMFEPPRSRTEPLLPFSRLAKIFAYGITMMVGTLAVLYYGLHTGTAQRALTLALTTFVLFQFFNVFNARTEKGTSFNAHFFDQPIFGTGGMTLADWAIATGVAASILILEEGRKLAMALLARLGYRAMPAESV